MNPNYACTSILDQLNDLISQIKEEDFCKPIESLSMSTIGQHLRHTLEFFICLEEGLAKGLVNYDKRRHDKLLETDKFLALAEISKIRNFIESQRDNRQFILEVGYDITREEFVTIETTYLRELVYNIEHAVHHMALIKIGVREGAGYISLPPDFGIAASTIRYKSVESSR